MSGRPARSVIRGVALAAVVASALAGTAPAAARTPYVRKQPPLLTPWTDSVSPTAPLPEYPRPQLRRARWLSLNGQWQYEQGQPAQAPPFGQSLPETILVPFPVQSPLSGIERGDVRGWYRRTFTVPRDWRRQHLILNFGAVSWYARVYVNGTLAGTHRGDYDGFSLDITRLLRRAGPNELVVGFYDPVGGAGEPVGKQVPGAPHGFYHTASAGIWQTVWLEPVAPTHVTSLELVPDLAARRLLVTAETAGRRRTEVRLQALAGGRVVASASGESGRPIVLAIAHPRLWSPSDPYLYGLRTSVLTGGRVADRVESYFAMRSIALGRVDGTTRILLNGRFVFETGALDQGYWPDGVYTAPTDAALRFDIAAAKRLGYNMLREHQKVQPDRWYYWADRMGLLVWQDMPAMPTAAHLAPSAAAKREFRRELRAIVEQLRSHPSIVTWVPFNEGWDQFEVRAITSEVKRLDPAALVDSDSGSANCCNAIEAPNSDVRDAHLYFGPYAVAPDRRASVIGEYGGVLPYPPAADSWPGVLTSIGSPVLAWPALPVGQVLAQQYAELEQEVRVRGLSAAVFTELASYEQELGILTYDRRVYTLAPSLVRGLNRSLIATTPQPTKRPPTPRVPAGATGLWEFDEGGGQQAADASGHGHPLTLEGAAGWTRGVSGGALSIGAQGGEAVSSAPLIDATNSFTVSAWLSAAVPGESGSAVSEPGTDGSSFSLGIETAAQGAQSLSGEVGRRAVLSPGVATWWTFAVPAASDCTILHCGVRANMRYDDGRSEPRLGSWHQVTGVFEVGTHTIVVYVDGIPEDVEHVDGPPAATGPLTVGAGAGAYGATDHFIGAIDRLRIYGRALTPGEVWQLFRADRASNIRSARSTRSSRWPTPSWCGPIRSRPRSDAAVGGSLRCGAVGPPTFDLQSHSRHSDGALAPDAVVAAAARAGVELLALSDHDTVDGVEEAERAAAEHGVRLVPAVEISAIDENGLDLHILGYLIDHRDRTLSERLHVYRGDRERRAERMAAALRELGYELDGEQLETRVAHGKPVGRPHLAQAVVAHPANAERLAAEGLAEPSAFLASYLIEGRPAFRPRLQPTIPEAIGAIHDAGGVAVWAHPFWDVADAGDVLSTIGRFVAAGLDGVEAFYPTHTHDQAELLCDRCAELGLLTTGSSDFHGPEHRQFSRFRAFSTYGREPELGPIGSAA